VVVNGHSGFILYVWSEATSDAVGASLRIAFVAAAGLSAVARAMRALRAFCGRGRWVAGTNSSGREAAWRGVAWNGQTVHYALATPL